MNEPRQRRAFIPGAIRADDSEVGESSAPSRSVYEKYKDWTEADERRDEKERVASWMKGFEPREWWEVWEVSGTRIFCMEFPETTHYFVCAFEKATDIGKLYTWCFGCKNDVCGACGWIRKRYVAVLGEERRDGRTLPGARDVPF